MLPARTIPGFAACLVGIHVKSAHPPQIPPCARRKVPSHPENSVLPRRAHLAPLLIATAAASLAAPLSTTRSPVGDGLVEQTELEPHALPDLRQHRLRHGAAT